MFWLYAARENSTVRAGTRLRFMARSLEKAKKSWNVTLEHSQRVTRPDDPPSCDPADKEGKGLHRN